MTTRAGATATVHAQAKVNLALRVLALEASGFHQIETVFHRLDLADTVRITLREDGARLVRTDVDVGPPETNLAFRAAALYCETRAWSAGFDIAITKRIPLGGGLGGGSADAAAVLRALDALAERAPGERPLGEAALVALGAQLGADVPFLCSEATAALAWGRGERLLALEPLPTRPVALVIPAVAVPTALAYRWVDEWRAGVAAEEGGVTVPQLRRLAELARWEEVARASHNDFTAPVAARALPDLPRHLAALREHGARLALLSGSGSTCFGVFDAPPDAAALAAATGCAVVLTRTAAGVERVRCGE